MRLNQSGKIVWLLLSVSAIALVVVLSMFRGGTSNRVAVDPKPSKASEPQVLKNELAPQPAQAPVNDEAPPGRSEGNPDSVDQLPTPLEVENDERDADPAAIARRDEEERRIHALRNPGSINSERAVPDR